MKVEGLKEFEILQKKLLTLFNVRRVFDKSLRLEVISQLDTLFERRCVNVICLGLPFDIVSYPFLEHSRQRLKLLQYFKCLRHLRIN